MHAKPISNPKKFYLDAIEQHGSQRAAAKAVGMNRLEFVYQYRCVMELCPRCGKKPESVNNHRLCEKCRDNYCKKGKRGEDAKDKTITKQCLQCGGDYHPDRSAKNRISNFCSHSCRGTYWQTGTKNSMYIDGTALRKYPKEFNTIRPLVLARDENVCQLCGNDTLKTYEAHHIDYNKHNNTMDNLITLCRKCHSKTGGKQENRNKWLIYILPPTLLKRIITKI